MSFKLENLGNGQIPWIYLYSLRFGDGESFLGRNCMSRLFFAAPESIHNCRSVVQNGRSQNLRILFAIRTIAVYLLLSGIWVSPCHAEQTPAQLEPSRIASIREMTSAIGLIIDDRSKNTSFEAEKSRLNKIGECISRIVTLHAETPRMNNSIKNEEKELFLMIRGFLKKILEENEKLIWNMRENKLDKLKNPAAFFQSAEWQNPQYLISLSSYWIGWNGYYAGTMASHDEALHEVLLQEAIKGFSRSFVDFQEEAVIVRSLFGRALCYVHLKDYQNASRDLITIKKKITKDDPLYLRCLYEEVLMIYEGGNYEKAQRALQDIEDNFPRNSIPPKMAAGLDRLESKVLVAILEKRQKSGKNQNTKSDKIDSDIFQKLRRLADNPSGAAELYRYVQENSKELQLKPFEDLGPVAAMALGDIAFENKNFDKALKYYQPLNKNFPKFLLSRKDGVVFRMGYVYCKKEDWENAIKMLEGFHKEFPDSVYIRQSIPLYYLAAANNYAMRKTEQAHHTLIDAASLYAKRCSGDCPQMSEVQWELGKHYQKKGNIKLAQNALLRVDPDSPNYLSARYNLLQNYVNELETMEKKGEIPSIEAKKMYKKGDRVIAGLHKAKAAKQLDAVHLKTLDAPMRILEANLRVYGPESEVIQNVKILKDFEKKFPHETKLYLKAFQLRMITYQRLSLIDDARKEVARYMGSGGISLADPGVFINLATRFEKEGQRKKKGGQEFLTEQYWDISLVLLEKTKDMACNKSELQKYCDRSQLNMARIYIDKNQPGNAEALYQNILKQNSMSADAVYNLGRLYEKIENWGEALNVWRRFSDGVKSGTYHWFESRYNTAICLFKLGDDKKACEILTTTMVLHPDLGSEELTQKYVALKAEICQTGP